jgi:hypothetical protein
MELLQFTSPGGQPVYVNGAEIIAVRHSPTYAHKGAQTEIIVHGTSLMVADNLEAVVRVLTRPLWEP